MSLRSQLGRRSFMLATLSLQAACTLTPVYGPSGPGTRLYGKLRPRDPLDFQDFEFNRHIATRLGPDGEALYDLDYQMNIGVVPQAITPDEVTTRYSLNGTADFALKDRAGHVLISGNVSGFTSYSTTGTTIATLTAEVDARKRLSVILADQVVTRLLAAADQLPDA